MANIKDMDRDFEELARKQEVEQEVRKVVEVMEKFVNNMSCPSEVFAEQVTRYIHRTLQQTMFDVFIRCIRKWAQNYREGNYDLRNEFTCKMSDKIMKEALDNEWFGVPFI